MLVQLPEHFFKLPGGAAGFDCLLHDFSPLYVEIEKSRDNWYNDAIPVRDAPVGSRMATGRGVCRWGGSWGWTSCFTSEDLTVIGCDDSMRLL